MARSAAGDGPSRCGGWASSRTKHAGEHVNTKYDEANKEPPAKHLWLELTAYALPDEHTRQGGHNSQERVRGCCELKLTTQTQGTRKRNSGDSKGEPKCLNEIFLRQAKRIEVRDRWYDEDSRCAGDKACDKTDQGREPRLDFRGNREAGRGEADYPIERQDGSERRTRQ